MGKLKKDKNFVSTDYLINIGEKLNELNTTERIKGLEAALEDCCVDKEFYILTNEDLEKKVEELEIENRFLRLKLKKIKEVANG